MSFAETFIEQLKENDTDSAISTLKGALKERFEEEKTEVRKSVQESYGLEETSNESEDE